jgi:hypothetical protein
MPVEPDPPTDALEAALADVIDVLAATGTAYALIGGLATGFRSRPRYTQDIDLLIDIPQIQLPDVLETAKAETGPTGPIRVATTEGLILMKLLAYRLQDQADIEALVAANRGTIDLEWIRREWETIFSINDARWRWLEQQVTGQG